MACPQEEKSLFNGTYYFHLPFLRKIVYHGRQEISYPELMRMCKKRNDKKWLPKPEKNDSMCLEERGCSFPFLHVLISAVRHHLEAEVDNRHQHYRRQYHPGIC